MGSGESTLNWESKMGLGESTLNWESKMGSGESTLNWESKMGSGESTLNWVKDGFGWVNCKLRVKDGFGWVNSKLRVKDGFGFQVLQCVVKIDPLCIPLEMYIAESTNISTENHFVNEYLATADTLGIRICTHNFNSISTSFRCEIKRVIAIE